jgi:hypothetical protein
MHLRSSFGVRLSVLYLHYVTICKSMREVVLARLGELAESPTGGTRWGFQREAGNGLLSRHLSVAVPSALQGLTAVFGMGTGVAPAR